MFDAGRQLITVPRRRVRPIYPVKADTRPKWGSMSEDEMRISWQKDVREAKPRLAALCGKGSTGPKMPQEGVGVPSHATIFEALAHGGWMSTHEILDATGLSINAVRNGTNALVTRGILDKRLEKHTGARRAFFRRKAGVDSLRRGPTKGDYVAQRMDDLASVLTHEWQTRKEIAKVSGMTKRTLGDYLRRLIEAGRVEKRMIPRVDGGLLGQWRLVK